MNIDKLNQDVIAILENKIALSALDYSSPDYDELEEALHDKEDALTQEYGSYLEEALHEVHDEFCPDTDVLLPIAYLPRSAKKEDDDYVVTISDGVYVEVDDYASEETKLVILPNPVRIELMVDTSQREVVWKAE